MYLAKAQQGPVRQLNSGFTMLEVLVTFVILAIGILGIVTLLVTSKTSEYESAQRAQAVNLAEEMVEKIRSNPRGVLTYVTGLTWSPSGTEPLPNCETGTCTTPAQIATWDLYTWRRALEGWDVVPETGGGPTAGLQQAAGCVQFTAWDTYTRTGELQVRVQWTGLLDTGSNATTLCAPSGVTSDRRREVVATTFVVDPTESPAP